MIDGAHRLDFDVTRASKGAVIPWSANASFAPTRKREIIGRKTNLERG
jgi:hypothetical protein